METWAAAKKFYASVVVLLVFFFQVPSQWLMIISSDLL